MISCFMQPTLFINCNIDCSFFTHNTDFEVDSNKTNYVFDLLMKKLNVMNKSLLPTCNNEF